MTNAAFAMHVSLIVRVAAQWSHELVCGMWNPDFCSAEADPDRFIEEIETRLANLKALTAATGRAKSTEPRP